MKRTFIFVIACLSCSAFGEDPFSGKGVAGVPGQPSATMFGAAGIVELLVRTDVRAELELLDAQIDAIEQVRRKMRNDTQDAMLMSFRDKKRLVPAHEIIRERVVEIQHAAVKEVEQILLPHQMKRLRQIDLQRRVRGATFGLFASPAMAEELKYTDEQEATIKKVIQEVEVDMQEVIRREHKKAMEKVLNTLTPEQRQRFKEVFGEEFRFTGVVAPVAAK